MVVIELGRMGGEKEPDQPATRPHLRLEPLPDRIGNGEGKLAPGHEVVAEAEVVRRTIDADDAEIGKGRGVVEGPGEGGAGPYPAVRELGTGLVRQHGP